MSEGFWWLANHSCTKCTQDTCERKVSVIYVKSWLLWTTLRQRFWALEIYLIIRIFFIFWLVLHQGSNHDIEKYLHSTCSGSPHTSQSSHFYYPSLWLLVPGLSSYTTGFRYQQWLYSSIFQKWLQDFVTFGNPCTCSWWMTSTYSCTVLRLHLLDGGLVAVWVWE